MADVIEDYEGFKKWLKLNATYAGLSPAQIGQMTNLSMLTIYAWLDRVSRDSEFQKEVRRDSIDPVTKNVQGRGRANPEGMSF